jgi:DNA-binding CsgD family transcriptional regulator
MPPSGISGLDRLNAAERELLMLLGRGHTIKSIAHLRGLSEASVNERFRSARRKTGMGSSREIARLILAQEIRHEIPELAPRGPRPYGARRTDAFQLASLVRRWRPIMTVLALLASAILAQQTAAPLAPPVGGAPLPPAAQAMFNAPSAPDLAALHAEVDVGPADPTWTVATERALARAYERAAGSARLELLDASCNATLCEVLGVAGAGVPVSEIPRLLESLQGQEVDEAARGLGLENVVQSFGSPAGADAGRPFVFAVYWRRTT